MEASSFDEKPFYNEIFFKKENRESIEVLFSLTPHHLILSDPSTKIKLPTKDIIGATIEETKADNFTCTITIHMIDRNPKPSKFSFFKSESPLYDFAFLGTDIKVASQWKNLIIQAANNPKFEEIYRTHHNIVDVPPYKKHLLVFVNPVGGNGKAAETWKVAKEILKKAGCEFTEILTQYCKHAQEYIFKADSADLKRYDGFVTVSGDGLPHEVINGIMARPDWEEIKEIPIGPLPGGSGNAVVAALLSRANMPYSLENACYLVAKSHVVKSDLTKIERSDGPPVFSFLHLIWGILSYVDFESEKCRFLGGMRFDIYAVLGVAQNLTCRGKITYSTSSTELPALNEEISGDTWRKLEDEFSYFNIHNLSHMVVELKAAPLAEFGDGYNHFFVLKGENCTRSKLVKTWTCLSGNQFFEGDKPKAETGLLYEKIKAFRLEPAETGRKFDFSVDGERFASGKVQGRVVEKVITFFSGV